RPPLITTAMSVNVLDTLNNTALEGKTEALTPWRESQHLPRPIYTTHITQMEEAEESSLGFNAGTATDMAILRGSVAAAAQCSQLERHSTSATTAQLQQ